MKKLFLWLLTLSWAILIFYLTSIPNLTVSPDTLTSLIISNGAHFLFFGIQAVLLKLAISNSYVLNPSFLPITLTSLYGVLDELHQINIPGRSADPMDWFLDTLGALVFVLIMRKYTK